MKEKILKIITINDSICNRRITESYFKKNYNRLYLELIEKYKTTNISFNEILYLIINDLSSPSTCIICNNIFLF